MGPGFESLKVHHIVSVFYVQGPPVPIPNTVVKLLGAEDTRLEATWENRSMLTSVGLFYVQGPPVPIPNTVVKLLSAEDTRLEATWENRSRPTFLFLHSSMAEHPAVNRRVVSSSLTGGAIKETSFVYQGKRGFCCIVSVCYSIIVTTNRDLIGGNAWWN